MSPEMIMGSIILGWLLGGLITYFIQVTAAEMGIDESWNDGSDFAGCVTAFWWAVIPCAIICKSFLLFDKIILRPFARKSALILARKG